MPDPVSLPGKNRGHHLANGTANNNRNEENTHGDNAPPQQAQAGGSARQLDKGPQTFTSHGLQLKMHQLRGTAGFKAADRSQPANEPTLK